MTQKVTKEVHALIEAKIIGKRLKKLRVKADESVKETASAVGVSESALRMYETGQRIPRDEVKERFSNHFKKSIEFIFFTP